ncbi:MAG TPA: threonine--tRNA ligase, partial [Planctomycetota bacterium]|nr:threonine--tRNA ligase [Planctomycetota bacterium]
MTPFDLLAECNIKDEEVLAAKWNDHCIDLYTPLMKSGKLDFIKVETPEGLEIMRHSMAHLMAHAVLRIYKDVEFAIGPVIEDGFYYDFDLEHKFSPEDFEKIEAEMKKIIEENLPIRRIEFQTKEEALKALKNQRAKFKKELIQDLPDNETFSFYTQGDFMDLCRGPHVDRTGKLKYFKIMSVAGAYWRGDERREMLQRLYATAFFHQNEVDEFVQAREEAKKRDHRKLGRELDLFSFQEEGPGFPFWHPRGTILIKEVIRYVEKILIRYKYSEIMTPMILNEELWHKSGHWDHYQSNMYFVQIDEQNYAIKPMNCPGCCLVFKNDLHSFRDLPVRLAEWGKVHRHEKRGVLSGLQRVRAFTQDDAHVF